MSIERPNLLEISVEVRAYIEILEAKNQALEAEIEQLKRPSRRSSVTPSEEDDDDTPLEPSEPPTTVNVISFTSTGVAKRTPRHLYYRQRRGGMGVFDIDTPEDTPPAILAVADESQSLILVTNQARAFRLPINELPESAVRSKGQKLDKWLSLRPDEQVTVIFPDLEQGYVILVSERGHVRRLRYHYFGAKLRPGTIMYNLQDLGPPAAACWATGDKELFITTQQGRGIRFAERLVPANGCLGIRLDKGDKVVSVANVSEDSSVFLMNADGKGTIRLMSGFSMNKAPGTGGKVVMKTDCLIGAVAVDDNDDIFAISRLNKIIRFQAIEVPPKEGVVQGVNCMALRSDETVAIAKGTLNS